MDMLINVILFIGAMFLAISAVVAIYRIAVGPSQLDRSLGSDLVVAVVIGSIGAWAVFRRQDTEMVILLAMSMLGFTGAVSIARLVSERVVYRPKGEEKKEVRDGS